jgi:hypothetical protein
MSPARAPPYTSACPRRASKVPNARAAASKRGSVPGRDPQNTATRGRPGAGAVTPPPPTAAGRPRARPVDPPSHTTASHATGPVAPSASLAARRSSPERRASSLAPLVAGAPVDRPPVGGGHRSEAEG